MTLEQRWHRVICGEATGPAAAVARGVFTGFSGLYHVGLGANLALYQSGLKQQTRPVLPVISVGNLSLGGTGKSTAVRYLARQLQRRGIRVGIVLRGHGRRTGGVLLASDGRGTMAPLEQTGDEAAEMAQTLPEALVAVGKRRERAIELLREAGAQVALLDDGFQYFRMARDLNIVLIGARDDPGLARLFPRGILREPWAHLRRADQVWITHTDQVEPEQLGAMQALVARHAPDRPVILAHHEPTELLTLQGESLPLSALAGQTVLAVSGLGCPASFEYTVGELGARVVPLRFEDHHQYTLRDWRRIGETAAARDAATIVTTAKDAVKLPADPPLPVWVLHSELEITAGEEMVLAALDTIC